MKPDVDLLAIGETMLLVAPEPGQALELDARTVLSAGGAESNVAIGVAALGLDVAWYSRIGGGPLGDMVVHSVARRGVDTSHVRVEQTLPTGLMIKKPGAAGSEVFYYRRGSAASTMCPEDLVGLPSARVVHVSGITAALSPSCLATIERVLDRAFADSLVSFDINYRPALWRTPQEAAVTLLALARRADVVFVGRDEAEALWGTVLATDVRALLPDVPYLVVKDGEVEAVEFGVAGETRVPTAPVEIVEPVGAGDAFAAGWLAAHLRGTDAAGRLGSGHRRAAAVLLSHTDQAHLGSAFYFDDLGGPR